MAPPHQPLPQPLLPHEPQLPGEPLSAEQREQLEAAVAEQRRQHEEALKQLRSLRRIISLAGFASPILCGLVVWKLFNWHLASWIGWPAMGPAAGIALAYVAQLLFHQAAFHQSLEDAYEPRQRIDAAAHAIGILLGTPLLWLLIGWLLKVLL